MKKIILFIVMIMSCVFVNAQDNKSFEKKGNTISVPKETSYSGTITKYKFKDEYNVEYPIYISDSGNCFIIKDIYEQGKSYKVKQDLNPDICSVIAAKCGIKYDRKIIKVYDYKFFNNYGNIIDYFDKHKNYNIISVIYKDYNYEVFYYYNK